MKSYTDSKEDKKKFILNYEIKDDKIIINLASKESYTIPYTFANETRILSIMKNQVSDFSNQEYLYEETWELFVSLNKLFILFLIVPYTVVLMGLLNPFLIPIGIWGKIFDNDIKKNKMFIENEVDLNERIKENPEILANITKRAREIIQSEIFSSHGLTINSIDKIKYKDLKQILENIKKEEIKLKELEELSKFEFPETQDKSLGFVKNKRF